MVVGNKTIWDKNILYAFIITIVVLVVPALASPVNITINSPVNNANYSNTSIWLNWTTSGGVVWAAFNLNGVENTSIWELFNTSPSGNGDPRGITSNGPLYWVTDPSDDKVYQYFSNGTYSGRSFGLANQNGDAKGITQDGTYFWVVDDDDKAVYRYDFPNGGGAKSFSISSEVSNPTGITGNGTYLWVVDSIAGDDVVLLYDFNGIYISNFTLEPNNNNARGITQDGNYFWVVDITDDRVYKYTFPDGDYTGESFDIAFAGNNNVQGIEQNGTYFWVVDDADKAVYRYNMSFSSNSTLITVPEGSNSLTVWVNSTDGDVSSSSIINFIVDVTKPSVRIYSPLNVTYNNASLSLNYTVSDANLHSVWYEYNGVNTTLTGNTTFTASEGQNTLVLWANDDAGNENSTTVSFMVDTTNPSDIVIVSPTLDNNTNTSYSWFIVNVTFTEANPNNCTLIVNNGVLWNMTLDTNSSDQPFCYINVTGQTQGMLNYSIMVNDISGHSVTSGLYVLGIYPDIMVGQIMWDSSDGNNHPRAGSDINISAFINNTGGFNINNDSVVYLWWDGKTQDSREVRKDVVNSSSSFLVSFSTITENSLVTNGLHTITVEFDPIGNVSEANETNNNATLYLYIGYNVTVLSLTPTYPIPDKTVTINVSVRYGNGDPVTGINESNFTVSDLTNSSNVYNVLNLSDLGAGYYLFNTTVPNVTGGVAQPGIHNLTVQVTNGGYSGNGSTSYNLSAPNLVITRPLSMNNLDLEGQGSKNRSYDIYVLNNGSNGILSNVNISITVVQGPASIDNSSCSLDSLGIGEESQESCVITVTISGTGDIEININVTGTGPSGFVYRDGKSYLFTVNNTVSDSSVDDTSDTGTGGGAIGTTCELNSDCAENLYCSLAGVCTTLSCGTEEYVENHQCMPFSNRVDIISFDSSAEVVMGGSIELSVTVKNTGNYSGIVSVSVNIGSGIDYTVNPDGLDLGVGESTTFTVTLNMPGTISLGEHIGTFSIMVGGTEHDSKSFSITVLATEDKKAEIEARYENLETELEELHSRYERVVNAGLLNTTVFEDIGLLVESCDNTMEGARTALDSNDYVSAEYLLDNLESLIGQSNIRMDEIEAEQSAILWAQSGFWFMVGGIVVMVFILGSISYYFYMPTRGYRTGYGYSIVRRNPLIAFRAFLNDAKGALLGIGPGVMGHISYLRGRFLPGLIRPGTTTGVETPVTGPMRYSVGYEKHVSEYKYPGSGLKPVMNMRDIVRKISSVFRRGTEK